MNDCPVYTPDAQELVIYEALWRAANPGGSPELSGRVVVPFFLQSKVDKGILKQIWTFSCGQTLNMNKTQFFTAIRFIVMVQNGELPINKERLLATATLKFEPPKFVDVNLPTMPPGGSPIPVGSPIPSGVPSTAAGANGPPPYFITPEDHVRYHELFLKTDANNDGKVAGKEAVELFRKSGLQQDVLKSIWTMADHDKDNFLAPKEFCVAFHLIVCISKRGMPCPPALPPPLLSFLSNAPVEPPKGGLTSQPPREVTPTVSPAPAPAPMSTTTPPQIQQTTPTAIGGPVSTPVSVGLSISDAFGDVGGEKPMTDAPLAPLGGMNSNDQPSTSAPPTDVETSEISKDVSEISSIARKTLMTQQETLDSSERITDSMKSLISKLKGDKISLSAAVEKAESECSAIKTKQTNAINEISTLQQEISSMQAKLAAAVDSTSKECANLTELEAEKATLTATLNRLKTEIDNIGDENVSKASSLGELAASNAALASQENALKTSFSKEKTEALVLNSQISILKELVGSMQQQVGNKSVKLEALEKELVDAKQINQGSNARIKEIEADLQSLKDENDDLKKEKSELLNKLAAARDVTVATTPLMKGISSDSSGVTPLMNNQTRDYMASIKSPDPALSEVQQLEVEDPPKVSQYEQMTDDPLEDPFAAVSNTPTVEAVVSTEPPSSAGSNVDPFGSMDDPFGLALAPTVTSTSATVPVPEPVSEPTPQPITAPVGEDPFGSVAETTPVAPTVAPSSTIEPTDDPFGSVSAAMPSNDVDPFGSMGGDADIDPFGGATAGDGGFDTAFPASFDAPTDGSASGFDADFPAFGDSPADPFASPGDVTSNNNANSGNNDSFGAFPAF